MSAWEVKQSSPIMDEHPTDVLCVFIQKDERGLFNECHLGYALYDVMLEDLSDISNVNNYDENTIYELDDKVLYEGVVLQSLANGNAIEPCDILAKDFWAVAPKFTSPCYQELYDKFLKFYIAFTVVGRSMRYSTYQSGSKGITKYSEDFRGKGTGLITVSLNEFYEWKKDILYEAERSISNVFEYIKYKHSKFKNNIVGGCNFSIIPNIDDLCNDCDPKKDFKKSRSKFHFIK